MNSIQNYLKIWTYLGLTDGMKAMLFSIEELQADFKNYEIIELVETVIELNEGVFHNGQGSVIRFVRKKIKY